MAWRIGSAIGEAVRRARRREWFHVSTVVSSVPYHRGQCIAPGFSDSGLTVFALRGRVQADEVASHLSGASVRVLLQHSLFVVGPLEIE